MNSSFPLLVGAVGAISIALTSAADAVAPAGRYTTTGTTVYDTKTKLTWQRAVPLAAYTWQDAKTYCESPAVSAILGGTARLPTVKELLTIVDYSRFAPSIDPTAFPATPVAVFWSSSALVGSPSGAWYVSFLAGNPANGGVTLGDVRCVR